MPNAERSMMLRLRAMQVLSRMPTDPEALFLAAAGAFVAGNFDSALSSLQQSLMAEQRASTSEVCV